MEALNGFLRPLVDGITRGLSGLPEWVTLAVWAFVFTVVGMVALKLTIKAEKVDAAKRKIAADVLELRLFNDDLGLTFRTLLAILGHNGIYIGLLLLPIVLMSIPLGPVFMVLHYTHGYDGLRPGQEVLVRATLDPDSPPDKPAARLVAPAGVEVETPTLWIAANRELVWRVKAVEPGEHQLALELDGQRYTKSLQVADGVARRSPVRPPARLLDQMEYPAEAPLPADGLVESISLDSPGYPGRGFAGEYTWIILLLVLCVPFYLLLKGPMKVSL